MNRREFLAIGLGAAGGLTFRCGGREHGLVLGAQDCLTHQPFKISLAEWSLVRTIRSGKMTNLDFPRVAKRDFGIDCIEFVDQFFADKAKDMAYLRNLKKRAADEGVTMGLIMLDTNGPLGIARDSLRERSVEKTKEWIDAAKFLGCRTVRVNARGEKDPKELAKHIADCCAKLADYAAPMGINLVIENHGGPSSDPVWLTGVMKAVGKDNFGTLPDFGNFPDEINRYDAVEMLMPYAKAVSAKATRFTPEGLVAETDYPRMMRIVRDAGYHGYVGVESGASKQTGEADAIRMTRDLLKTIREQQRQCRPIFNGKDLSGWVVVAGGEWIVEDGVLIGRNGRDWTTDPEKTGSWLRTQKQYDDFRLELQYTVGKRSNSGAFFRSAAAKNPAFTGYEMQIYDAPGAPPSKSGPGAIYDVVAPTKNLVRPAGEWNTVTIIARGKQIAIEMNGRRVVDTKLDRSMKGYIGLQNHDARSVVRFRNIRVQEL